jgi:hypothetical protein
MTQRDFFELLPPVTFPTRNEISRIVRHAIQLMHTVGEDAEREYEQSVRRLRAEAVEAAAEIARSLHVFSHDLAMRWSLLYLLGDVRHAACVDVLAPEAKRELGQRVSQPGACVQRVDFEEIVCVMAIEALGRLASDGDVRALDVLVDVVATQDRRSLRRPAAVAVIDAEPRLRSRIAELLPAEDRYVLDLREATTADLVIPPPEQPQRKKRGSHSPPNRPFPPPQGKPVIKPPGG